MNLEQAILARLRTDILSPERLRAHIDLLLTDLSTNQQEAQSRLQTLKVQLVQATLKADNLVNVLAERPNSQSLLLKLDEIEADQRRLVGEIKKTEAEN